MYEDTIAAISTPPGEGGIGIVRISGKEAFAVGRKLFKFTGKVQEPESHRLYYGHILDPGEGGIVDEALAAFMRAPRTYTREDVVEINCHGGIVPLARTLQIVLAAGARLAEPGEFTRRAFINGRIDLAQAEAVIQVIRAKTETAMKLGVAQLKGRLSRQLREIRRKVVAVLSHIEASVDFPEHQDVEDMAREKAAVIIEAALRQTGTLLDTADQGRIMREGLRTAIAGRPNVGKSSLLNALLQEQRAIVTSIPGTTRDVIEESLNIGGLSLTVLDTAGIRKARSRIEKIGVERSLEAIKEADLVLLVIDARKGLTGEDGDIMKPAGTKPVIVVANKTDLLADPGPDQAGLAEKIPAHPVVFTSLYQNRGLDTLAETIKSQLFSGRIPAGEQVMVTTVRHKEALRRTRESLAAARESLAAGMDLDVLAIDLYDAADSLGEITGETARADVVEEIFKSFCIGK
jgi:tRNA modification GTPase